MMADRKIALCDEDGEQNDMDSDSVRYVFSFLRNKSAHQKPLSRVGIHLTTLMYIWQYIKHENWERRCMVVVIDSESDTGIRGVPIDWIRRV